MAVDGWRVCTVDEIKADRDGAIAIGPFGSRMKADRYTASGVPVIRGNNLSDTRTLVGDLAFVSEETADELRSSNVFPSDLVFPHRGAIGEVGIVPGGDANRYGLSTSLMKLSCHPDLVDPLFVFYFFRSSQGRHALLQHASTVGTPGIGQPLTSLRSISLSVPPLPEQRAIAYILGTLDDKIELTRRMNETLEAMARALFQSWFVDFDPVRAKAEGRNTGLPKEMADLFPDRFEDSELGEIPKGWRVASISDLTEINTWTLGKDDELNTIEYLEISEVTRGDIGTVQVFARGQEPSRARRRLQHGDTVLSTVRPERRSYLLCLNPSPTLIASTGLLVLSPSKAPWSFVHAALTRAELFEHLGQQADGGAYPAIRPGIIGQWKVSLTDTPRLVVGFHKS